MQSMRSEPIHGGMRTEDVDAGLAPTRILHVVDTLATGGLETMLTSVVERTLGELRHAVCCVRELGPVADRLRRLGVPIYFLGKRPGHDWTMMLRIAKLCRAERPHIVHTRNWGAIDGILGARLGGVPVVIHSEHGRERWDEQRRRRIARRLLAPLVDRFVTVSEDLRQRLHRETGARVDKVTVVRNGVDTSKFKPASGREQLRMAHGYHPAELLVGAVGRLAALKGHSGLLTAFPAVVAAHAARLIILGDGPERGALERQADTSPLKGVVQLVGRRDDVPEWLGMLDVFVQPSLVEGMSNAILEAMAVGLPVVATRIGGNAEVVADGVTGRIVPVRDPDALAQAIGFYCADPQARARHGAAGRKRIEEHYSSGAMISDYMALYRGALMQRS
jgi:sugar transferase (PEP-CTERM/EpsH1 system associated)